MLEIGIHKKNPTLPQSKTFGSLRIRKVSKGRPFHNFEAVTPNVMKKKR
jgi:hypothetical protein